MNFRGATLDQYDQVSKKIGLTAGARSPGAISHGIAKTEDGIRVVDVWETKEGFDRYVQEQIGSYTREAGLTDTPETRLYGVHNHLGQLTATHSRAACTYTMSRAPAKTHPSPVKASAWRYWHRFLSDTSCEGRSRWWLGLRGSRV
jgi:hypothetical protein